MREIFVPFFLVNKKLSLSDLFALAIASTLFKSSSLVTGKRNASSRENKHRIKSIDSKVRLPNKF